MDRLEELAELKKRLAELEAEDPVRHVMKADITACIPCGPGALYTLWHAIQSLEPGAQAVPLRLHLTAQENAPPEAAAAQAGLAYWGDRIVGVGNERVKCFEDYHFVGVCQDQKDRLKNICASRKMLVESVDTEYLLWLDADVRMPAGGVTRLLEEMRRRPKLAWLSIPYSFNIDHPQNGCTLTRTELMKKLTWAPKRCSCAQACSELQDMGYEVENVKDMTAVHMKFETAS